MGALYEQAYQPLCVYFHRRLPQSQQYMADDLAADVFEKAVRAADRFEQRGLPQTAWLYAIAGNHLVDYARGLKRVAVLPLDAPIARNHRDAAAEHELLVATDRVTLAPLIEQLMPDQRRTIAARFVRGMSIADTAAMMGKTPEAVKKLQARALATLKRKLEHAPQPATPPETTVPRKQQAIAMRLAGMPVPAIADTLGISIPWAYTLTANQVAPLTGRAAAARSAVLVRKVGELRAQGMTCLEIAAELGITARNARRYARKAGYTQARRKEASA